MRGLSRRILSRVVRTTPVLCDGDLPPLPLGCQDYERCSQNLVQSAGVLIYCDSSSSVFLHSSWAGWNTAVQQKMLDGAVRVEELSGKVLQDVIVDLCLSGTLVRSVAKDHKVCAV